jgi:chlorite dismutase
LADEDGRQFAKYSFFSVDPAWRRLPEAERTESKLELAAVVEEAAAYMFIRSFSLVGLRGDADFLLWQSADSLEDLQEAASALWRTRLGAYLTQPYSYLAMTRRSQYVGKHRHEGQEGTRAQLRPSEDSKYFIVYPFLKTRDWYLLPQERRQEMMGEHFRIGHKYPSVKINTTYSFGLDDQEFVVAFETDVPRDFLDLVMELRSIEGSRYTLRDTPIFTCIRRSIPETLDTLGG